MTSDPHIPVAISARHVHLTRKSIDRLFGEGHELHVHAMLSQPGQFAAEETVTLVGPNGLLPHVRIVGPVRSADQVEISRSDEYTLGLDAPVRLSGELDQTPGILIQGPLGQMRLDHGVVLARRHIHMSPAEAEALQVFDHEIVSVAIQNGDRDVVYGDVVVRVASDYRLELHLDTDEGNAAGLHSGDQALLIAPTPGRARLQRRP